MKRTLVLVAVLLLLGSLALRAEGAPGTNPGLAGGGCALPDLAQLSSPDQIAVAALGAGLQISVSTSASTVPACPVRFQCSSIAGCGSNMVCSAVAIGKCCSEGNVVLCCSSTIFVVSCPCKCVLEDCPHQCAQSTQVSWSCS
jgi:hypothetical protein